VETVVSKSSFLLSIINGLEPSGKLSINLSSLGILPFKFAERDIL